MYNCHAKSRQEPRGQFSMGAKGALASMVFEALTSSPLVFHKNIGVSKTMGAGAGGGRLKYSPDKTCPLNPLLAHFFSCQIVAFLYLNEYSVHKTYHH